MHVMAKHKRLIWCWHILTLIYYVTPLKVDEQCRHPLVDSRRALYLYQRSELVTVTVHRCLYRKEHICQAKVCNNCTIGISSYTVPNNYVYQYSEITPQCTNASKTGELTDKYGFTTQVAPKSFPYKCNNNKVDLTIWTSFELDEYEAEADLVRDMITLRSGTGCRYSAGFCFDAKEGKDVVWVVDDYGMSVRKGFKGIETLELYKFISESLVFVVVQSNGKHFVLEVEGQRVYNTWRTLQAGIEVSEESYTSNGTLDVQDQLKVFFQDKRIMYDYLVEKCMGRLWAPSSSNSADFDDFLVTMLEEKYHLLGLDAEVQRVQFRVEVLFYVIASGVVCLIIVLGFGVYLKKKNQCHGRPVSQDIDNVYTEVQLPGE